MVRRYSFRGRKNPPRCRTAPKRDVTRWPVQMVAMAVAMACPERDRPYTLKSFAWTNGTRSMQSAVRCSALPQFGSQSELERFIKQILQRLPCLARNFAKQQRCVVIDINCEVGYIGFIRFGRWITESSNKSFNQFFLLLRCHA